MPLLDPVFNNASDNFNTPFQMQFTLHTNEFKPPWGFGWIIKWFVSEKLWTTAIPLPGTINPADTIYPAARNEINVNNSQVNAEEPLIGVPDKHHLWNQNQETAEEFLNKLGYIMSISDSLTQYQTDLESRCKMTAWWQREIRTKLTAEISQVQIKREELRLHGLLVVSGAVNYINRKVDHLQDSVVSSLIAKSKACFDKLDGNNSQHSPLKIFFDRITTKTNFLLDKAANLLGKSCDQLLEFLGNSGRENTDMVKPSRTSSRNANELTHWGNQRIDHDQNPHQKTEFAYSLETEEKILTDFLAVMKRLNAIGRISSDEDELFDLSEWKRFLSNTLRSNPNFHGTPGRRAQNFCEKKKNIITKQLAYINDNQEAKNTMHAKMHNFTQTFTAVANGNRMLAFQEALVKSVQEPTATKLADLCSGFLINQNILAAAFGHTDNQLDIAPVWKELFATLPDMVNESTTEAKQKRETLELKFSILNNFSKAAKVKGLEDECAKILKLIETQVAGEGLFDQICYEIRQAIINSIGATADVFYSVKDALNEKLKAFDYFLSIKNTIKSVCQNIVWIIKSGTNNMMETLNNALNELSQLLHFNDFQQYLDNAFSKFKIQLQVKCQNINNFIEQLKKNAENTLDCILEELKEFFTEGKEIFKDVIKCAEEELDYVTDAMQKSSSNQSAHKQDAKPNNPRSFVESFGNNVTEVCSAH